MMLPWRQWLARKLHEVAWRLSPIPLDMSFTARTGMPMTEATAGVLSEILSREIGHPTGIAFQDVDGSEGFVSGPDRASGTQS